MWRMFRILQVTIDVDLRRATCLTSDDHVVGGASRYLVEFVDLDVLRAREALGPEARGEILASPRAMNQEETSHPLEHRRQKPALRRIKLCACDERAEPCLAVLLEAQRRI